MSVNKPGYSFGDIPQSKIKQLNDAGIYSAQDLLQYVPRKYIFWEHGMNLLLICQH